MEEYQLVVFVLEVVVQLDARSCLAQQRGECRLPDFERLAAQVSPELEQIECEKEEPGVRRSSAGSPSPPQATASPS
jgi:hypothetical protein